MILSRQLSNHPRATVVATFLVLYILALQYFRNISQRDPSSLFFDPKKGFDRFYSDTREAQADRFINEENTSPRSHPGIKSRHPELCVGIAGVQREGVHYFSSTVGSLLDGLSSEERDRIFLSVLLASANASNHEAWSEPWVHGLPDSVFSYADFPESELARLHRLETTDKNFDYKILVDYRLLLNSCLNTKAPYILILEDDVLGIDGWLHRTMNAIYELERKPNIQNSLYVRLFYTDKYLGWNSELWPRYLIGSIAVELLALLAFLGARRLGFSRGFTPGVIFLLLAVFTPASILLFFAAGRLTVSPPPAGLSRMDSYGCCSQALLYPRAQVPGLVAFFEEEQKGKVDVLVEKYAKSEHLARWAWTPVLFQHVGTKSASRKAGQGYSKWGLPPTASIWNFKFEQNDAEALEFEHDEFRRFLSDNVGTLPA